MEDRLLRWIWPKLSYCPDCSCQHWRESGRKVQVQFRQCIQCERIYTTVPIAREIDNGGMVSVIIPE